MQFLQTVNVSNTDQIGCGLLLWCRRMWQHDFLVPYNRIMTLSLNLLASLNSLNHLSAEWFQACKPDQFFLSCIKMHKTFTFKKTPIKDIKCAYMYLGDLALCHILSLYYVLLLLWFLKSLRVNVDEWGLTFTYSHLGDEWGMNGWWMDKWGWMGEWKMNGRWMDETRILFIPPFIPHLSSIHPPLIPIHPPCPEFNEI